MRCRLSELHCGGGGSGSGGGGGGGGVEVRGKGRNKITSSPPEIYYKISDHYFIVLGTDRSVGAPDRCHFGKAEVSEAMKHSYCGVSRIRSRIQTLI